MESMQLVITPQQIDQVAQLADQIWRSHFEPIIGAAQVQYMLEQFQNSSAIASQIRAGYEYYLLYEEKAPVGYFAILEEPQALFISKLYVDASCRGKGLASACLRFCIARCREHALPKIWLKCNKHNADSLAVYEHLGFRRVAEDVGDIGGDFVTDDFILEKQVLAK